MTCEEELESWDEDSYAHHDDLFYPFGDEESYNFTEWLVEANVTDGNITSFFKRSMPLKDTVPFKSAYMLRQLIDKMEDGLGWESWKEGNINDLGWNDDHNDPIRFYYRDIFDCVKWLLRQPSNQEGMAYAPIRKFIGGQRSYDEMNTGDWWWRTQV